MKKGYIITLLLLFTLTLTSCGEEDLVTDYDMFFETIDLIDIYPIEVSDCTDCIEVTEEFISDVEDKLEEEIDMYYTQIESYEPSSSPYTKDSLWRVSTSGDKFPNVREQFRSITTVVDLLEDISSCSEEYLTDNFCEQEGYYGIEVSGTDDVFQVYYYQYGTAGNMLYNDYYIIDMRDGFQFQHISERSDSTILTTYDGTYYQQLRSNEEMFSYTIGNLETNDFLSVFYLAEDSYSLRYYDSTVGFEYLYFSVSDTYPNGKVMVATANELEFEHRITQTETILFEGNLFYYDGWTRMEDNVLYNDDSSYDLDVSKYNASVMGFESVIYYMDITEDDLTNNEIVLPDTLTTDKKYVELFDEFISFRDLEDHLQFYGQDIRTFHISIKNAIERFDYLYE